MMVPGGTVVQQLTEFVAGLCCNAAQKKKQKRLEGPVVGCRECRVAHLWDDSVCCLCQSQLACDYALPCLACRCLACLSGRRGGRPLSGLVSAIRKAEVCRHAEWCTRAATLVLALAIPLRRGEFLSSLRINLCWRPPRQETSVHSNSQKQFQVFKKLFKKRGKGLAAPPSGES